MSKKNMMRNLRIADKKVSNFRMFKVKKQWVFASAMMLSMLGAGMMNTYDAKADTVSPDTVTSVSADNTNQQKTADSTAATSAAAPSSAATATTEKASSAATSAATDSSSNVSATTASSAATQTDQATSDSQTKDAASDKKADASSSAAASSSSDTKSDSSAATSSDATSAASSSATTTDSSAASQTSSAATSSSADSAAGDSSAAPDLKGATDGISAVTTDDTKKDDVTNADIKDDIVDETTEQSKKTDTNKKKKDENEDLRAILAELEKQHPGLGAGIEFLADGTLTINGTAVSGLKKDANGNYTGLLNFLFEGTSLGIQLNEQSDFLMRVPPELQALFANPQFRNNIMKYISGSYSYTSFLGEKHVTAYTAADITISADGSTITFRNPGTYEFLAKTVEVNITLDLGTAVNDTGIIIPVSDENYNFGSVLMEGGTFTDWNVVGNYSSDATLKTNDLMGEVGVQKPYVDQPVYDNSRTVTGKAAPGATVTVWNGDGTIELGHNTADANGNYTVSIPSQSAGWTIQVTQTVNGDTSDPTYVIVKPAPKEIPAPVVDQPHEGDTTVTGKGSYDGDKIYIFDSGLHNIGVGEVGADGTYSVTLSRPLENGEQIHVIETDGVSESAETVATVVLHNELPAPTVDDVYENDTWISGKADQEGDQIIITDSETGEQLGEGTTTLDANGNVVYAVNLDGKLKPGQQLTITEIAPNGEQGRTTTVVLADRGIPDTPVVQDVYDNSTTVTGKTSPDASVTIYDSENNVIGTGKADSEGNFSVNIAPQPSSSKITVTVQYGKGKAAGTTVKVLIPAPSVNDMNNNDRYITGKGSQAGNTIEVYDVNNVLLGSGVVNGDGTYSFELNRTLIGGETVTIYEKDATQSSKATTATVNGTAEVATPSINGVMEGDTTVTGTGTAGQTVVIRDSKGGELGRGTVNEDGTYSIDLSRAAIGDESITATQYDAVGNESDPSATTVQAAAVEVPKPGVDEVREGTTTITGTGEAGNTITVYDVDGNSIGTGTVNEDGTYSVTIDRPAVADEILQVTQTDADGNESKAKIVVVEEVVPAPAPTINDSYAGSTTITGTGEAGDTVTLYDSDGKELGSAVVGDDGTYTIDIGRETVAGEKIDAIQTNDEGGKSDPVEVTVAPLPAPAGVTINSVLGTITGTGVPGATILIYDKDGHPIGDGIIVGADGTFSYDSDEFMAGETYVVEQKNGSITSAPTVVWAN
jgi:hypothetical protein